MKDFWICVVIGQQGDIYNDLGILHFWHQHSRYPSCARLRQWQVFTYDGMNGIHVWPSPRPVPHHALPTYLSPNLTPCPVISTRASSNPINDRWDISRTLIGVHLVTWRRKVVGRATVTDDPPIPQPTIGIRPNGCPHIPICPLPSHGTRRRGTDPAPIIRGHRSQWSTSDNSETLAGARWTTHK